MTENQRGIILRSDLKIMPLFSAANLITARLFITWNQRFKKYDFIFVAEELRAVIERVLPLDEVQEAHRIVDSRHKRGIVILLVSEGLQPEVKRFVTEGHVYEGEEGC
ncbi:MAG: zinc-binding dehydrogenase [Bacillota bacterium]|nr:zinc-binding dehydrogenase [Bacillota bacterium]